MAQERGAHAWRVEELTGTQMPAFIDTLVVFGQIRCVGSGDRLQTPDDELPRQSAKSRHP